MKIALMSDVHLEFGDLPIEPVEADVLVLAGDIFVAKDLTIDNSKRDRFVGFITRACSMFKHVIMVCGNHEHYHGDIAKSSSYIRETFADLDNFHYMDREWKTIDDVTFVGGTLWTDMNKEDPITLSHILGVMNDYRIIQDSDNLVSFKEHEYGKREDGSTDYNNITGTKFHLRPGKLNPQTTVVKHKEMLEVIKAAVEANPTGKFVVVGHHAPSKQSTKPGYEREVIINGAYSSDLSEFILDRPQIKLWVHGHTHSEFDYMIGSTRIVANPRGYVGYERDEHDVAPYFAKVMEV